MARNSPQLCRLPRAVSGVRPDPVVKLRRTKHGGASRGGVVETFSQLTVPAEIADLLPAGARFRVTFEGDAITYTLIGVTHHG